MKKVTEELIRDFKIMELGYDMMGYKVEKETQLSFHHLLIARRYSRAMGIGDGYLYWNGSILRQNTAHNYLHIIERLEPELFYLISSEILDEKIKGKIDRENLVRIREILLYFELAIVAVMPCANALNLTLLAAPLVASAFTSWARVSI